MKSVLPETIGIDFGDFADPELGIRCMHISRMNRISYLRQMVATCAVATLGACTVKSDSAPSLAGPSGFGLSLTMTANAGPYCLVTAVHIRRSPLSRGTRRVSRKPNVSLQVGVCPPYPVSVDQETVPTIRQIRLTGTHDGLRCAPDRQRDLSGCRPSGRGHRLWAFRTTRIQSVRA